MPEGKRKIGRIKEDLKEKQMGAKSKEQRGMERNNKTKSPANSLHILIRVNPAGKSNNVYVRFAFIKISLSLFLSFLFSQFHTLEWTTIYTILCHYLFFYSQQIYLFYITLKRIFQKNVLNI